MDKMTIKKERAVELWRDTKGHISDICRSIGISRQTFYNWMKEDEKFAMALIDAEGELGDDIRNVLIQKAADGDMTAVIFYLKNRHPDFKQEKTPVFIDNRQITIHPSLQNKYGNIQSPQGTTDSNKG